MNNHVIDITIRRRKRSNRFAFGLNLRVPITQPNIQSLYLLQNNLLQNWVIASTR
jgi:hypothetical protein